MTVGINADGDAEEDDERAAQRAHWAARAAAWNRTADDGVNTADPYNIRLMDAAGVKAGQTVVDLASGAGEPALGMARRVGARGMVFATDLVPEMLGGARRRAVQAKVANIRYVSADMHDLPYRDAAFDALTCRFGFMFPDDSLAAAGQARRILKPGCRAAFLVWGPVEDNVLFNVTRRAVRQFLGLDPDEAPGKRHRYAAAGSAPGVLGAAGFKEVTETDLIDDNETPADEPFWRARLERSYSKEMATLTPDAWQKLEAGVVEALEPYRDGALYRLRTFARLCVGTA